MAASSKKLVYELFVAKVPWSIANKQMREYFSQFGPVQKCTLLFNKETGFHRGYGWVSFSTEEGLNNTLQTEPHIIEGTKISVQKNTPTLIQSSDKDED